MNPALRTKKNKASSLKIFAFMVCHDLMTYVSSRKTKKMISGQEICGEYVKYVVE